MTALGGLAPEDAETKLREILKNLDKQIKILDACVKAEAEQMEWLRSQGDAIKNRLFVLVCPPMQMTVNMVMLVNRSMGLEQARTRLVEAFPFLKEDSQEAG